MKQLTMTKVLTPLAALAFAFGVQAAAVSTDGFETDTSTVVTNRTGWSFTYGTDGADDASVITAYDNNAPSVLPYGISTAGDNYLKLSTEDGTLFRSMDGGNGAEIQLNTGLFVDTDVQFTVTDASDSPTNTVSADDKLVIWLEANGNATNLCVLGNQFAADGTRSDKVYTLGTSSPIVPGQWYRLTVKAISSYAASATFSYPAFQVYLNGTQLSAVQWIAKDGDDSGFMTYSGIGQLDDCKPYIPARTATMATLTKVGFSGEGALDSVVVTREVPVGNPAVLTFNWDSPAIASVSLTAIDATITPSGSSFSVEASNTPLALALNAASGYNLANYNITVGGVAVESLASITVVPDTTKTINIVATPKDTVKVTFSLDPTWADYEEYITSVMIGDSDVTAQALQGIPFDVNLKVGTNVTVAVNLSEAVAVATLAGTGATELTINGLNITVNEFGDGAAEITIGADTPGATMGGVAYATFADALNAAKTAHSGSIKLGADPAAGTFAIGASDDITVDLAGHDINGVDGSAVFTVAAGGTLTITNSTVGVGAVIADTDDPCISNTGTLNLQAGKFSGTITGGTINVTGGAYTAIPADATVNYPTGQELVEDTEEVSAYVYKLGNATYTVTYYDINDDEITESGTTYTYGTGLGSLASAPVVTGKTFGGWYATSARTGDAVTSIGAAETGAKTFYAKYTDNTYTIKFVYGLNGETTNTQTLAYGATPTAPTTAADVIGYTWAWDTTPVAVVADATYTAVYTPIEYTVLFISGEGTTTTQTIVKTYGQTILAEDVSAAASVSGKNFTAWDPVPSFPITVTADATYTAQYEAAGGSDWSDTPAEIPAETSAATQYPALKDSALATADAKELTVWAKAKGVAFSDIAADATGTYVDAFLLNCTTEQVAAEKAAFKLNITVGAGGAITVTLPDGKIYNGDLQMKGSNDLSTWTDVNAASSSYKFYKYSLGL